VVGWGNLAQEIQQNYRAGQRVLLEGRLAMIVVERPEGFKEKQAELTVQRIYDIGSLNTMDMAAAPAMTTMVASGPAASGPPRPATPPPQAPPTGKVTTTPNPPEAANPSYDDIPF
jgi:single-strand DNA-binding protein